MAVPMEYLAAGRSPVPGRLVAIAVALVAALALGAVAATTILADRARTAIGTSLAAADEQSRAGAASVRGTVAYAEPLVWSASVPDDVRASLQRVVREDAARVAGMLAGLADDLGGAVLLPWQGTERAERDAAVARILSLAEPFALVARDVRNLPALPAVARP
jgi:hypothetical protein